MICAGCEVTVDWEGPDSFRKLILVWRQTYGEQNADFPADGSNSFAVVTFKPVGRMIAYLPPKERFSIGTSPAVLRRIKSCQDRKSVV